MRIPDRYWWVEALIGLATGVGIVVAPVIYLGGQLPLDAELGYSYTNDLLLAVAAAGAFLMITLMLVITAARSRVRYRQRKFALAGNVDTLPLSRITPKPSNAPEVSLQPLVLMWSAGPQMRYVTGPLQVLLVGCQALIPVLFLVAIAVGAVMYPVRVFHADIGTLRAIGAGIVLCGAATVRAAVSIRGIPTLFGRPFGITASDEGVECHTELGRRFFVPWAEMRLFEIDGSSATGIGRRRFRLYGQRLIAEWHDNPMKYNEYAPHDMTAEEMAVRLQAIVNLIAARTGLAPRTLSKALRMPGANVTRQDARNVASGAAISLLIFGVLTLAGACAVVLLPLTTSTVLNLAVAGSLVALVIAFTALRIYDQHLQRWRAPDMLASALPPDSPTGKYIVLSGMAATARGVFGVAGLALCVNFLPVLALLAPAPERTLLLWLPVVPTVAASVLIWLLCLYGLFGVGLLRVSFTGGATAIRASATSLSMTIANRPITLLWEQVAAVTARTRQGRVIRYAIADSDNKIKLSWPADPSRLLPPKSGDDSFPVTPGELAALASARSGKPIELREM